MVKLLYRRRYALGCCLQPRRALYPAINAATLRLLANAGEAQCRRAQTTRYWIFYPRRFCRYRLAWCGRS